LIKTFSAFNERTKGYKNAQFDIVFDTKANQGQIFQECGIPGLLKQVVDVSGPFNNLTALNHRATTLQYLHMARQAQVKHSRWRATSTK